MTPHSKDASMKQHLDNCKTSGLSQKAYCQQHKIPAHIFSYYKKKLGYTSSKSTDSSHRLIPVNLISRATSSAVFKISHTNGFSVEVNADAELGHLKSLLELLRSVP